MSFLIFNVIVILMALEANGIPAEVSPNIKILNDGAVMPSIAFGTFTKIENMAKIQEAILWAAEAGYRHFNTAVFVDDDTQVGQALGNITRSGLITREDVFITTTTLDSDVKSADEVVPALERDLRRLQLDYVDLYLVEFSSSLSNTHEDYDIIDIWKGMEKAQEIGLTKSIGVSNFNSAQINKILLNSDVRPAVNQIEVSPTYTELDLVAYCQKEGIEVMAYAPFGLLVSRPFVHSAPSLTLNDERIKSLATKYEQTPSQIVLRYLIDRGIVPIPESLSLKHIKENIEVFDFQLSPKEVYLLNELDTKKKVYPLDESIKDDLHVFIYGNDRPINI